MDSVQGYQAKAMVLPNLWLSCQDPPPRGVPPHRKGSAQDPTYSLEKFGKKSEDGPGSKRERKADCQSQFPGSPEPISGWRTIINLRRCCPPSKKPSKP